MDDSKTQLHEEATQEIGLKKNLQTSQSDKVKDESIQEQPAPVPEESTTPVDANKINFGKETSE